jgi:hypothetical protein
MSALALALLAFASVAHADLYRWVDSQSGSVKLSSSPPPWYETGSGPDVERIPSAAPAGSRAPAQQSPSVPLAVLETRWRQALHAVAARPGKESAEALVAITTQVDRADPAGMARRRQESAAILKSLTPQK